jgi:hypothetical protein
MLKEVASKETRLDSLYVNSGGVIFRFGCRAVAGSEATSAFSAPKVGWEGVILVASRRLAPGPINCIWIGDL